MSLIGLVRRKLRLTPMDSVLRALQGRKISLSRFDTLEVFGGSGNFHTTSYAHRVAALEIWEMDPHHEAALRANFPQATVKITDSYAEMQRTANRYHLIVVDNPMGMHGEHCEHFDLFPAIFQAAQDACLLFVNVIPMMNAADRRKYPYLFGSDQLARRRAFYQTEQPEQIPLEQMVSAYRQLCQANGYALEWHFAQKRTFVYYLVLKIQRI